VERKLHLLHTSSKFIADAREADKVAQEAEDDDEADEPLTPPPSRIPAASGAPKYKPVTLAELFGGLESVRKQPPRAQRVVSAVAEEEMRAMEAFADELEDSILDDGAQVGSDDDYGA
jgi:hypothetical protein